VRERERERFCTLIDLQKWLKDENIHREFLLKKKNYPHNTGVAKVFKTLHSTPCPSLF
jgi:hypothetical protein